MTLPTGHQIGRSYLLDVRRLYVDDPQRVLAEHLEIEIASQRKRNSVRSACKVNGCGKFVELSHELTS